MNLYTCDVIEDLVQRYSKRGGEAVTVVEGFLGYGTTILCGDGLKTIVIKEVFLNEWSTLHKVRMYNKCPKKYQILINDTKERIDEIEEFRRKYP